MSIQVYSSPLNYLGLKGVEKVDLLNTKILEYTKNRKRNSMIDLNQDKAHSDFNNTEMKMAVYKNLKKSRELAEKIEDHKYRLVSHKYVRSQSTKNINGDNESNLLFFRKFRSNNTNLKCYLWKDFEEKRENNENETE